jgi:hypothetical protein
MILQLGDWRVRPGISGCLKNRSVAPRAQSLNLFGWWLEFTGLVLRLTISVMSLSINHLKDKFEPAIRSRA